MWGNSFRMTSQFSILCIIIILMIVCVCVDKNTKTEECTAFSDIPLWLLPGLSLWIFTFSFIVLFYASSILYILVFSFIYAVN